MQKSKLPKVPITLSQILFFLKVDIKYNKKQAADLDLKLFPIEITVFEVIRGLALVRRVTSTPYLD